MTAPSKPLRVLLCGAPPGEADTALRALERSGAPVAGRIVTDTEDLAPALHSPLDLLLLWDRPAGGPDGRGVLGLLERLALRVPLVVLTDPERDQDALELLALSPDARGATAVVYRDRMAPLAAIARAVPADARRRELVDLARAGLHGLNNLLAPIPLATRMLSDGVHDPRAAGLLETIETSIERATAAVGSLYRSALWCAGQMEVRSAPAPLRHLVEIVGRTLRDGLPGLRVETDYPPDLPPVAAAADEVRQLLFCLALTAAGADRGAGSDRRPAATVSIEAETSREGAGGGGEVLVVVRPAGAAPAAVLDELSRSAARLGGTLEVADSAESGGYRLRLPAAPVTPSARA
jgi:hypothetical protein